MQDYIKNRSVQDSIVVLLLGLALGIHSGYSFFHAKVKAAWIMSPYLFPMLIACFAIGLSYSLFMEGKHQVMKEKNSGIEAAKPAPIKLKKVTVTIAFCLVYYAAMTVITFLPATALFLAAFMWYMGEHRLKVLIPLSLIMPVLLYVIFQLGLNVRLP